MSDELHHECGIVALYWLGRSAGKSGLASRAVHDENVAALMPRMLLDVQNRGQLAAGMSSYDPSRPQIIDTYKDIGTVTEAFRMSHPAKYQAILTKYAGRGAIGHTRYATSGADDARCAQPFERHHGRLWKWFSFAWNGNLANFGRLRDRLLARRHYHFTLNTDTEMLMHALAYRLRGDKPVELGKVMTSLSRIFDGAYNIVFLDAMGRMLVARDPLGFRPLSWAVQGRLFAAASESTALANMGFTDIHDVTPGEMILIEKGRLRHERFAKPRRHAHCFFEWVYFSNVGSTIADSSVYMTRAMAGKRLAGLEREKVNSSCIVVPVPDTAKAAADAFAYEMGIPSVEGLIRNRYVGRSFIEPTSTRRRTAKGKYTPLPAVLAGKKVFLIEDSIVRSTTLAALADQIRKQGRAKEIHVRVACPPIITPCFYGIDMSTFGELFARKFVPRGYDGTPSEAMTAKMAEALGLDSLRYLSVADLAPCLRIDGRSLCTGCVTGKYPTEAGNRLLSIARRNLRNGKRGRTYE
ncbi:MAG: amidophosphoribosyltransferase [Planctomycetota bacterium]|nr:amidophosphoribosyltransferase [Planctomycetota bacterium]